MNTEEKKKLAYTYIAELEFKKCIELGVDAVEPLIDALKDQDINVCANAAISLRHIGDPRAIEPIKELLSYPDSRVQTIASEAISALKNGKAKISREQFDNWTRQLIDLVKRSPDSLAAHQAEARRIGEEANKQGGLTLMQELAYNATIVSEEEGIKHVREYINKWWGNLGPYIGN